MPSADRDTPPDLGEPELVYELKKPVGVKPVLLLIGGAVLLGVAGLAFLIGLVLPPGGGAFPLMIAGMVGPMLGALAAFGGAFALMRSPRRVAVGPAGLTVEGTGEPRTWRWGEIGWATVATGSLAPQRRLAVYDANGKKLVVIGPEFEDFDGLAESVKAAIARKADGVAERVQARKARMSATFLVLGGIAFLALAVANGVNAQHEKAAAERLARDGVEAQASVLKHYLYNVTPRVEYLLTTPDGREVRRDAMMRQGPWEALQGATTVPVRYDPADPENNRLVAGEVEDQFGPPQTNLLLSFGVGAVAAFFLAAGLMQWFGWDIDLDSKTGRVSVKRFGTGR